MQEAQEDGDGQRLAELNNVALRWKTKAPWSTEFVSFFRSLTGPLEAANR